MKKVIAKRLLAFFFPPKCIGCGGLMPIEEGAEDIFCPFCRTSWEAERLPENIKYLRWHGSIGGVASLVRYRPGETEGVPEKMIYHMKHRDERRVFDFAAREMIPLLEGSCPYISDFDGRVVFSYPPRRRSAIRKDGFDQAKRLAQAVSRGTGYPVVPFFSRVKGGGKEQKQLSAEERKENAAAAYQLLPDVDVKGKIVFLFDDVYTTGATLHACARLLVDAGAVGVFFVTVGRTTRRSKDGFLEI